jgi:hypothetical protein
MSVNQVLSNQKAKLKSKSYVKTKTFYGGEEIKDVNKLPAPLKSESGGTGASGKKVEFIGSCVKLERSSIAKTGDRLSSVTQTQTTVSVSKRNRKNRVNFTEVPQTFEYLSYEAALKELGIDPNSDPDYNDFQVGASGAGEADDDDENDAESASTNTSTVTTTMTTTTTTTTVAKSFNAAGQPFGGGNFNNFKPAWITGNYELGASEPARKPSAAASSCRSEAENGSRDFLPGKDDEIKRWSCEIDSNILF